MTCPFIWRNTPIPHPQALVDRMFSLTYLIALGKPLVIFFDRAPVRTGTYTPVFKLARDNSVVIEKSNTYEQLLPKEISESLLLNAMPSELLR